MEIGVLKKSLIMFILSALMIGSCVAPVMAQGVTVGITVHVSFLYPLCSLSNLQVTLDDQTGRIIGAGMSSDGSEVIIPLRTETPIYSVTARAFGYANVDPYYFWTGVYKSWTISGVSTINVQTIGGDYWVLIQMSRR